MPQKTILILSCIFILLTSLNSVFAAKHAMTTKDIFSQYKKSIVQIRIVDKTTDAKTSIGSGFFVNANGLITTNYHVISRHVFEPEQYRIEYVLHHDNKVKKIYQAKLVNFDVIHDLALLQPIQTQKTSYLKLNKKILTKGENIFSLGNPHDLGMAIIVGTYNGITDDSMNKRIHLSGAINAGMSGGPSITKAGQVIGINVATAGNQIGFLVPVKYLRRLLKNKDTPKDFLVHIDSQLLANQNNYIGAILKKPFKTKKLAHYNVPDKLANYLTCWGDSESNDLPYKTSGNTCATKSDIYLAHGFTTGDIHYAQYHLRATRMSSFRFSFILENYLKNPGTYLTGAKKYFTNYTCKTEFIKNNNITFKLAFCLRGYKHFKNIYDMMLSAVTINKETSGIQTSLILAGVSYKNAVLFSKKYLAAFSKTP